MDIIKIAVEWAKTESLYSYLFIIAGVLFLLGTIGFWQLGKSDLSKAFITPTIVAGLFLLSAGIGLVYSNNTRSTEFPVAYEKDAQAFVQSEITRVDKTLNEYNTVALTIFPILIAISALFIVFVDKPLPRAISITIIATFAVILLVDSNAKERIESYKEQLVLTDNLKQK